MAPRSEEVWKKQMREGFWRTLLRVYYGIPGLRGTGEIIEGQFVGGVAGVQTGWPIQRLEEGEWVGDTLPFIDSVPIAGFYSLGTLWPQILDELGLSGNLSRVIEQLEEEFGILPPNELRIALPPRRR